MTKISMIYKGIKRGEYDTETFTYTKKVKDEHYCVRHHTYGGIQAEFIPRLKEYGCQIVKLIHETKTRGIRNYFTKFENYFAHGITDNLNNDNGGEQVFVHEDYFVCPEIEEETITEAKENPTLDVFSAGKSIPENKTTPRNNIPPDDVDADMICPTCHNKGHLTCGGELPHKYQGIFCYVYCITCNEIFNYIEPPKLMACSICRKCTGMRYYEIDGEKYPSVTSILDFLPVPEALARWKANPKNAGKSKRSMTIGTLLHYRIANYYARKAGLPPVPLELHPGYPKPDKEMGEIVSAMHSYFVEFDEKYHPEPLAVEQVIHHKVLKYAGTADFVCMIDGKVWLLDWKSAGRYEPDKKPYENYSAQLAAYQEALRHMERFTVEKLAVVYLAPEGFVFAESAGDMPRFMEALKLCTGAKSPTPPG